MSIEIEKLSNIIEAALLAFGQPLSVDRLMSLFSEDEQVSRQDIREALQRLQQACEGGGIELVEVGSGFRYQARKNYAQWVSKLWEEKPPRYSRALLETLVLVAYRQPITRAEIEDIRGVSVSSHIMKTLQERDWVRVVGHKDVPGKPALYATTKAFLDYFNLKSLDELPSLMEIRDLDKISAEIDRQSQEVDLEQGQANIDAQQLFDSEDEDRLLPDGDVDHGDGIEDSVDVSVASSPADLISEEQSQEAQSPDEKLPVVQSPEETVLETMVETLIETKLAAATESVELSEAPQTTVEVEEVVNDSEQPHIESLMNNDLAVDENTGEFLEVDSSEHVGELEITAETADTDNVEFTNNSVNKYDTETVDTAELSAASNEADSDISDDVLEQSTRGVENTVVMDSAYTEPVVDETVSEETMPDETVLNEKVTVEGDESQPEDGSEVAEEPRFSTTNYGLRSSASDNSEQVEPEHDQSEYEEELDRHSERLSAAEPNS